MFYQIQNRSNGCSAIKRSRLRRGLSLFELTTLISAVAGGLWLGASYLQLDLRVAAASALDQAELLETLPPDWQQAIAAKRNPDGSFQGVPTYEEEIQDLKTELTGLEEVISTMKADKNSAEQDESSYRSAKELKQSSGDRPEPDVAYLTQQYWKRLIKVVNTTRHLENEAIAAQSTSNIDQVAQIRGRAAEYAVKVLKVIPNQDIDPQAKRLGQRLIAWYEGRSRLYSVAAELLRFDTTDGGWQLRSHRWAISEVQHRKEGELLQTTAESIRQQLQTRHNIHVKSLLPRV